jgi:RHS repeat-associated protein
VRYVSVGNQRVARLDGLAGDAAAATAPSSTAAGGAAAAGYFVRKLASDGSWLYWLAIAVSGLLASLLVAFRRGRELTLLPRLAAWATCVAALSLLVLPSCSCEDKSHKVAKDPRDGSQEITTLPASAQFYLADWQESPTALVNAAGAVISRTAYHPYGSVRSRTGAAGDPWRFVGNEKDEGAGLGDFHARPYRAELGMFLGPDPVGTFEAEQTLEKPARTFAYVYGEGDPVDVVDRDGRCGTPYAAPGTGCTRNIGPQLPETAQKEVDRNLLKGWLLGAEIASYVTGAGEAAVAARALSAAIRARSVVAVARGFWSKVAGMTARSGGRQIAKAAAKEAGAAARPGLGKVISEGHAFEKHVIKAGEFKDLGVKTRADFATHIDDVVARAKGTNVRELTGGRTAYWNDATGTVVIRNPSAPDTGTAFRPTLGKKYFTDVLK